MEPKSREPKRRVVPSWTILIAAVLLIAAMLAARAWIHRRPAVTTTTVSKPAPPSPWGPGAPSTVAHVILSRHMDNDGVLDFEGILEMFSYAVAPLPGVTVPSGAPDATGGWAELALETMPPHFAELTPAQRAIALAFYQPAPGTVPMPLRAAAAPGGSEAPRPSARLVNAAFFLSPRGPAPSAPTSAVQAAISTIINTAFNAEASKLGHVIGDAPSNHGPLVITYAAKDFPVKDKFGNVTYAPAWTMGSHGPLTFDSNGYGHGDFTNAIDTCTIFVGPSDWNQWLSTPLQVAELYHEVFHCYQSFVVGHLSGDVAYHQPLWEREGGADWAAVSMTGFDESAFGDYLNTPFTALTDRSYDGVGLFFELEYLGWPLWPHWWQVWSDAAVGGWSTSDWFDHIAADGYHDVRDAWGASFYQDGGLGKAWNVTAPHQTAKSTQKPFVFDGGQRKLTLPPYATGQVTVSPEPAGTVVAISATGVGRLIDGAHQELVDASLVVLCWENCSCPSSTSMAFYQVQGSVSYALTALADGATAGFQAVPIGEQCKKKKNAPLPPPIPCPVACPGSNGDPHLVTVNLRRLEFQATGEFTLLRSTDGKFEVQVRQEPVPHSSVGATINTAVALRLGQHRIAAYTTGDALDSRVDGRVVTSTIDFGGDGRLVLYGKGFDAEAPDGSSVWAWRTGYGVNIIVLPSAALTKTAVGVLGPILPGTALPALPDGTTLPFTTSAADVYAFRYGRFADAWRVTDRTSLFDYDTGKSTASYAVGGFVPELGSAHALLLDPSARASAESTCDPVGPVELHDECVFDVAVTGQSGFVNGYAAAANFAAQGPTPSYWGPKAPAAAAPTGNATATPRSTYLRGSTELLAKIMGMSGSVLAPDGAVYATVDQGTPGDKTTELVAIDPAVGKVRTLAKLDASAGAATGVALADGSVWVVATSFTATGRSCRVVRMDATNLQVQATIRLPTCPDGSPAIAGNDGGVWVQQAGSDSTAQGELWRIDPSNNQVAGKLVVPNGQPTQAGISLGALRASETSVFWSSGADVYRVRPPWTTVEDLQAGRGGLFVDGDTAVVETAPGRVAVFGGAAQRALPIQGHLVGAADGQLYFSRPGTDGSEQLWREPLSGGTPALAAEVPSGTAAPWNVSSYDPRSPLWIAPDAVLTVAPQSAPGGSMGLYLIVAPLR